MAFLRTLFWIAITVVVVVFSLHNWVTVTLDLFGGLKADAKLPILLFLAFLLGFVPLYIWHHVQRWRYRRRTVEPVYPVASPLVPPATDDVPARTDPS